MNRARRENEQPKVFVVNSNGIALWSGTPISACSIESDYILFAAFLKKKKKFLFFSSSKMRFSIKKNSTVAGFDRFHDTQNGFKIDFMNPMRLNCNKHSLPFQTFIDLQYKWIKFYLFAN